MKKLMVLVAVMICAPLNARADGVTDFIIDPATGHTISVAGSYRLAADVQMTANVTALAINVDLVTLDLNGHSIAGLGATSTVSGITGTFVTIVTVRDGSVVGFGGSALSLGDRAVVRNIFAAGNNRTGGNNVIAVAEHSLVEGCVVGENSPASGSTTGIKAEAGSRVIGNTVENNGSADEVGQGIFTGANCQIIDNVVRGNTSSSTFLFSNGIAAGPKCIVRGNNVSDNDNESGSSLGIFAMAGGIIEGNVCSDHNSGPTGTYSAYGIGALNCTIIGNACTNNSAGAGSNGFGVGINAGIGGGSGSVIRGNRCEGNNGAGTGTGTGIQVENGCRIEANHCCNNAGGTKGWGIRVTGTSNLLAGNSSEANQTAGLVFLVNTNNRAHSNQLREVVGIDLVNGVNPASVGVGDLVNVVF